MSKDDKPTSATAFLDLPIHHKELMKELPEKTAKILQSIGFSRKDIEAINYSIEHRDINDIGAYITSIVSTFEKTMIGKDSEIAKIRSVLEGYNLTQRRFEDILVLYRDSDKKEVYKHNLKTHYSLTRKKKIDLREFKVVNVETPKDKQRIVVLKHKKKGYKIKFAEKIYTELSQAYANEIWHEENHTEKKMQKKTTPKEDVKVTKSPTIKTPNSNGTFEEWYFDVINNHHIVYNKDVSDTKFEMYSRVYFDNPKTYFTPSKIYKEIKTKEDAPEKSTCYYYNDKLFKCKGIKRGEGAHKKKYILNSSK